MSAYKYQEKAIEPGSPTEKRAKLLSSVNGTIDSYCATGRDIHGMICSSEMRLIDKNSPKYQNSNREIKNTFVSKRLSSMSGIKQNEQSQTFVNHRNSKSQLPYLDSQKESIRENPSIESLEIASIGIHTTQSDEVLDEKQMKIGHLTFDNQTSEEKKSKL